MDNKFDNKRFNKRGQLLLVTGILIAVVVVSTMALLNGINFTKHTGTEETIRETKQVESTVEGVRAGMQQVFIGVGGNGEPYVELNNPVGSELRYEYYEAINYGKEKYIERTACREGADLSDDGNPNDDDRMPKLDEKFLVTTGTTGNTFEFPDSLPNDDDNFSFQFSGAVDAPESGKYRFQTNSDDGSTLCVDGRLVVDNAGVHDDRKRSGSIRLSKGYHKFTVEMYERGGEEDLKVRWQKPSDSSFSAIPANQLSGGLGGMQKIRENVSKAASMYANISANKSNAFLDVTVDGRETVNGTKIEWADRPFIEPTSNDHNWKVVEGLGTGRTSGMPYLRMNLTEWSKGPSEDFFVQFEDKSGATDTRQTIQFTDGSISVKEPGGSFEQLCSISASDGHVVATLKEGALRFSGPAVDRCDAVSLADWSTDDHQTTTVRIENGDQAKGSFFATVGNGAQQLPALDAGDRANLDQTTRNVVVNPAVTVTYNSPAVSYKSTLHVMGRNIGQ